jgi:hypothetical protein
MPLLNFGQPDNGIMQMAYIVKDIRQAMDEWVDKLNVGPWFLLDHFTGVDPVYRGQRSQADVAIAMSFAGHMNIELIQPNDQNPSVYKELIDRQGYGFHHWGLASSNVDADIRRYEKMGMALRRLIGGMALAGILKAMPGLSMIQTNLEWNDLWEADVPSGMVKPWARR